MDKKVTVLLIIVFLLIGFGIGKISERNIEQLKLTQTQEELNQLKSHLEMFSFLLPEEIYNPDGIVTEVGNKFLVMEPQIQVSKSLLLGGKEFEKQSIKVNVDKGTEIFQVEIVEKALLPVLPEGLLCEPLRKVFLSLKDIKAGDHIFVASRENTVGKKEITAKEIQIGY